MECVKETNVVSPIGLHGEAGSWGFFFSFLLQSRIQSECLIFLCWLPVAVSGTEATCPWQPAVLCRAGERARGALLWLRCAPSVWWWWGPQAAELCWELPTAVVCFGTEALPLFPRPDTVVSEWLLTFWLLHGCRLHYFSMQFAQLIHQTEELLVIL